MKDNEPTVLDYVKSKLMPWKGIRIEIPEPKLNENLDFSESISFESKPLESVPEDVETVDSIND